MGIVEKGRLPKPLTSLFNLGTVIFLSFAIMFYVARATVPPQALTPQAVS